MGLRRSSRLISDGVRSAVVPSFQASLGRCVHLCFGQAKQAHIDSACAAMINAATMAPIE